MSAKEADELTARFKRDREIEAQLAPLEEQAEKLRSLLSPPRAGRHRERLLAKSYRLVLADVERLLSRRPLEGIDSARLKAFLAHRHNFFGEEV